MANIELPEGRVQAFSRYFSWPLRALLRTGLFSLIVMPWVAGCTLPTDFISGLEPRNALTVQKVQLETPPAIAPTFILTTPPAIAPEIGAAMLPIEDRTARDQTNTLSPTPEAFETLTPTIFVSTSSSPTASATSLAAWPTRTMAPTSTRAPSDEPPVVSTPTFTTAPTSTRDSSKTPEPSGCGVTGNAGYESTLIALINDARQAQGLHELIQQNQLTAAARVHSDDMACNEFVSHTGSDGSRPADRVTAQGYTYSWVGENIFAGSSDPQTTFDWWMNSEPHRNNILHANYTEIGVGYNFLADSRYHNHYTAVFARPR